MSAPGPGTAAKPTAAGRLRPWRFVLLFGVVSLLADFVYEGARSVTGPLLASLGASAAVVGVVTGVGEAAALLPRLLSGPLAERTGRFWAWTIAGYALTVAAVPLLGLAGVLWAACTLVIAERIGKAVRSPAKDTLLSHATAITGRGRGFAVHEAMDQLGALAGPLLVAAMLAAGSGYGPALGVLAVPGLVALAVLLWLRTRVPDPAGYETPTRYESPAGRESSAGHGAPAVPAPRAVPGMTASHAVPGTAAPRTRLPRAFWVYAGFTAATTTGFATFGVLSFHAVTRGLLSATTVPVLYSAAMGVDALAALATGWAYDRLGPRVLAVLPLLAATVPALAFTNTLALVVAGALVWGAATGVQESTLRATVADLVPPGRRASAYGIFAGVVGAATAAGGGLAGALYDASIPALITVTAGIQAAALLLFAASRHTRT
ncbi:major facilitator transporter [Candidatus Protofrankia californiensis]|uniref:Major facilitator transporter n=1 Tax=Candidatus Protofrankia californiensis TaxID=1839754 RepID=A0A1C3NV90_9ACTN|nr:MFS transporter [Protofrankia symbiont of Coriaria ruscifolia]SBW19346.1 major facilitator transporter [Candidatus Protofrankia californiensis]